jgi:uncharacterized membrane protein YedE/YeeE
VIASSFGWGSALFGLAGGALIGLAAAMLLLGAGRIAGVSGIAARAAGIASTGMPRPSAFAFLLGLPLGALIVGGGLPQQAEIPGVSTLAIAGLIVGFGTRLGSGCTSGHGVCGMSRLSPRSIAATAMFIGAGVATVTLLRIAGPQ